MEYKKKKVGLFTFGLSLIIMGTAVLLNRYSQSPILKDYYLLWPAFLILLGLEFIITKLYYDFKKEEVQLSPSGLSIFLVIVVIFVSFLWGNIHSLPFNFNFGFDNDIRLGSFRNAVHESYQFGPFEIENLEELVVNNTRGRIDIQPSNDGTLKIEAEISARTNDEEKAKKWMEEIITIDQGSVTTIESSNPSARNEIAIEKIDLSIFVPKTVKIRASTSFGDILVTDMEKDVNIKQRFAGVEIANIKGQVTIESSFGPIEVSSVTGGVEIHNRHGRVRVEDISGTVAVENEHGNTHVKNVGEHLTVNSRHGEVSVQDVKGNARISNEYDQTKCSNIEGNLTVQGRHSRLDLADIKGNIDAETAYDSIYLSNDSYDHSDITLSASYGSIHVSDIPGIQVDKKGNFEDASIKMGSGSQKIRLSAEHGSIRIEAR